MTARQLSQPLGCGFAFVLSILTSMASAELLERDWLTPGDGLLTLDTRTNLEWLDVPVSLLIQYGSTTLEAVPIALQELSAGGMFEDFTHAKRTDVEGLIDSAKVDLSSGSTAKATSMQLAALIDLLGATRGDRLLIGALDELDDDPNPSRTAYIAANMSTISVGSPPENKANVSYSTGNDFYVPENAGLFLYRNVVPELDTVLIVLLPLCTLAGRYRQNGNVK